MAFTVQYLELNDNIHPDDWIRPLIRSADYSSYSDAWLEVNAYGGNPLDHLKWSPVWLTLGDRWWGREYKDYNYKSRPFEAIRGEIPLNNTLLKNPKWVARHPLWYDLFYKPEYDKTMKMKIHFGKYKENTIGDILTKYRDFNYLNWVKKSYASPEITIRLEFLFAYRQYEVYLKSKAYKKFSETKFPEHSIKDYVDAWDSSRSSFDSTYITC